MFDNKNGEEKQAGFWATVVFHLSVLIILLLVSIGSIADQESSFVLDFSKQEEIEKEEKQIELKEQAKEELDRLLGAMPKQSVRNVAVDAGEKLKDNRGKTGSDVYKEAAELQKRLDASKREVLKEQNAADAVDMNDGDDNSEKEQVQAYKGPSVLTYRLDGRKASYLPVPAYKGYGGGDVYVTIWVNQKGRVVKAQINESASTRDSQLWEFALEAARRSRFSSSTSAPAQQQGEIVYRFIKQ